MKTEIVKTDGRHPDFITLVQQLDSDLDDRYGELQKCYNPHNRVDHIKDVIVLYQDKTPVACGAFKEHSPDSVEMKRIFVSKEYRRQGNASLVLQSLEKAAREQGYRYAVLETGIKQYEAIRLYEKYGYVEIDNYGPYIGNTNSLCMKKALW